MLAGAGRSRALRGPDESQCRRRHDHRHDRGGHQHGRLKAGPLAEKHQERHGADPAEARTGQRDAEGQPAPAPEPLADDGGDDDGAHAEPGQRHHHEGQIQQHRRRRERQHDHRPRQCRNAELDQQSQAEAGDEFGCERRQQIAQQQRQRPCARHQKGRKAIEALEFDEIDALAVHGEPEHEHGHEETREHHPPARIGGGCLGRGEGRCGAVRKGHGGSPMAPDYGTSRDEAVAVAVKRPAAARRRFGGRV